MDILFSRLPSLFEGLWLTLALAFLSLIVALVIGLINAAMQLSKSFILRWAAFGYTMAIRGVPEIVLMLLLFYGGQIAINSAFEARGLNPPEINSFAAGVLVLGFIYGAYMGESFRGGWQAIAVGQIEAAKSCGYPKFKMFRRIILPQLLRYALPSIGNNWTVMIKATAVVSLIGLKDLVWWGNVAGKSERQPFMFLLAVLVIYLVVTALSEWGLKWLNTYYNRGFQAQDNSKNKQGRALRLKGGQPL